ncbi:hypothetical protein [Amycolatopsis sp. NPDC051903]|uniref:hypothetical protein n=1 Tax=Amycolatopsis sp. NPDC051903 TaxID=3363936 RepID=UPI0037B7A79B
MTETDPPDNRYREPARGADPELAAAVLAATRRGDANELEEVATTAVAAGTDRDDVLRTCYAALAELEVETGEADEDPAGERVLEIMDRLTGWCAPQARIRPETNGPPTRR